MEPINFRISKLVDALGITKTAFAEKLKVTQSYISKLVSGIGTPSERLLDDICEKYCVRKEWLLSGEGEMFVSKTRNQAITDFAADLLVEEDESFRKRLVEVLSKLDVSDWEVLEKIAINIVKEKG